MVSDERVGRLLRELTPQVLGAVARRHGDFDSAEDAVQEALIAAARKWPSEGIPDNPRGWLYTVALRRLADLARSESARRRREDEVAALKTADAAVSPADYELTASEDDTLILLFMCCHPALTTPSAIALTLHAVGGLTTREIANAFMVPEATMAQRISRAKQSIRSSGVAFTMPVQPERENRLNAVLQILYLIFNEGYASSVGGALNRTDLSNEAIRLTRGLRDLLPDDGEVAGLLALMLLSDSRRNARTGPSGELIPLDEQDRTRWDEGQIREGVEIISHALRNGRAGYYQLQAAIAAIHAEATTVDETDWAQILALYSVLVRISENPMVKVSHAIASAMIHGPACGLELLRGLDADPRISGHYRLNAVRGHLHERAGDTDAALEHFRRAAAGTGNVSERDYLNLKAARLAESAFPSPSDAAAMESPSLLQSAGASENSR